MKPAYRYFAILILVGSIATSCSTILKSGSYCYICCACVGSGALQVYENGCFEMEYESFARPRDRYGKIYYGQGSYRKEKGKISLFFEDIPKARPSITLTKVGESDKVEIELTSVYDSTENTTVPGTRFAVIDKSAKSKVMLECFYNPDEPDQLVFDPKKQSKVLLTNLSLEATFIGYYPASCAMPPPGRYTAYVMLPAGYIDISFKRGDRKILKVKNTLDGVVIRDTQDRKLYFTTQSCACD